MPFLACLIFSCLFSGSNKKRKRERSGPCRPLKGAQQGEFREVYVKHLAYKRGDAYIEVEDMVRFHCKENGVRVNYAKAIPYDPEEEEIGCKITIKASDAEVVLDNDFWPDNIAARPWYFKPRNNNRQNESKERGGDASE